METVKEKNLYGRIYLAEGKKSIVLDADPHVMGRIRSFFISAHATHQKGEYTHNPLMMAVNLNNCRDLTWLMDRYDFEVDSDTLEVLKEKSNEFDKVSQNILKATKNSANIISQHKGNLKLTLEPRPDQHVFYNMVIEEGITKKILNADDMGAGKTLQACMVMSSPKARPALLVVPNSIYIEWAKRLQTLIPDAEVFGIDGFSPVTIPETTDVILTTYNRMAKHQDSIVAFGIKSVIYDEVQDLRADNTIKYGVAKTLSTFAEYSIGLSGTPLYNLGIEAFNVLDVIYPGALGEKAGFQREWCAGNSVNDTVALNRFLINNGLMIRRNREKTEGTTTTVVRMDCSIKDLKEVQDVAKMLSLNILKGDVSTIFQNHRELDWRLRQATGIAKARSVAEFVRMLVSSGETVLMAGWHRAFWDIIEKELKDLGIAFVTGEESAQQKNDSIEKFKRGEVKILGTSLRSIAGVDGLQYCCSCVVIGELDWSYKPIEQIITRVDRPGQNENVSVYFLVVDSGSDPFILETLDVKEGQSSGILDGKLDHGMLLADGSNESNERARKMAMAYLESIGEEFIPQKQRTGLLGKVSEGLSRIKYPRTSEYAMQEAINEILPDLIGGAVLEREKRISQKSRLDFFVTEGNERIVVECKNNSRNKSAAYKQIRRYIKEVNPTSVIMVAPWTGVSDFEVDGVQVVVINVSNQTLG